MPGPSDRNVELRKRKREASKDDKPKGTYKPSTTSGRGSYSPSTTSKRPLEYNPSGRSPSRRSDTDKATMALGRMLLDGITRSSRSAADAAPSPRGGGGWFSNAFKGSVPTSQLLEELMGRMGGPPQVQPNLVDVAATLRPYGDARTALQGQADQSRMRIAELAQRAQADTAASNQVSQAQLAAQLAAQQDNAAAARLRQEGDVRSEMISAAGQDADPAVQAMVRDAAAQAIAASAENRSTGQEYTKALQAEAALDRDRRAQDLQDQNRAATTTLDQNLMAAMLQLNSQEARDRASLDQANTSALNEAAQANAGYQRQGLEDRVSMADAIQQLAAQGGAYAMPGRQRVLDSLGSASAPLTSTSMGWKPNQVLAQAINSAESFDDALGMVEDAIAADDASRERAGKAPRTWDVNWIEQTLRRAYTQDESRLSRDGYRSLLQQLGLGLGAT